MSLEGIADSVAAKDKVKNKKSRFQIQERIVDHTIISRKEKRSYQSGTI